LVSVLMRITRSGKPKPM